MHIGIVRVYAFDLLLGSGCTLNVLSLSGFQHNVFLAQLVKTCDSFLSCRLRCLPLRIGFLDARCQFVYKRLQSFDLLVGFHQP